MKYIDPEKAILLPATYAEDRIEPGVEETELGTVCVAYPRRLSDATDKSFYVFRANWGGKWRGTVKVGTSFCFYVQPGNFGFNIEKNGEVTMKSRERNVGKGEVVYIKISQLEGYVYASCVSPEEGADMLGQTSMMVPASRRSQDKLYNYVRARDPAPSKPYDEARPPCHSHSELSLTLGPLK